MAHKLSYRIHRLIISKLTYIVRLIKRYIYTHKMRIIPANINSKGHDLPGHLVISLTSYPARFPTLSLTIRSLLMQSIRSDAIILWIAESDRLCLPPDVINLQQYGLNIGYCEDIRSYKKLIPSLRMFPDSFIVTCDDDLFYHTDWLRNIIICFEGDNKTAICSRAHRVSFDDNNKPLPYRLWGFEEGISYATIENFPTTGAGVLYPPHIFHTLVTDAVTAMSLCPDTDDVWFYWMLILNGSYAKVINHKIELIEWDGTQDHNLWSRNVYAGGNDQSISKMNETFGFPRLC